MLGELSNKMYIVHRDLKEASSVAKIYKEYIIELWLVDIKDTKNNKRIFSVQEIGQWTDRNKDELISAVEDRFTERLLVGIKEGKI